jgi:hypothetical protein
MTPERSIAPLHYFACASGLIAIWPFRYLWNNPPRFVGNHAWLAVFFSITVYLIVVIVLTGLMTICWSWRRSR